MTLSEGTNTIDGAHGQLHVHVWHANASDGRPIVAVHGVDGNHEAWARTAEALAGVRPVVAVDLRGRGSSSHDGPFGVSAHAEDLAAVVGATVATFGAETDVTLVGHSFGGHVVARAAADRLAAVGDLVLVDGGPPRVIPDGTAPEAVVAGALANIVPNLGSKPFPVSSEAVEADFASMVLDEAGARPLFDVVVPVQLLRAEQGVAPTLPPVVPAEVVAELVAAGVDVRDQLVAGVTHFSILGDPAVAAALG